MTSLNAALISGVTGLNAQSRALGTVSDNIANVNSIGYKRTVTRFETLTTDRATPANSQWNGVQSYARPFVSKQGLIQAAQSTTDFAVSGNGLFPVASQIDATAGTVPRTAERLVTRRGDFSTDKDGFLVNTAGYYLLAAPLGTADAAFDSLAPVRETQGEIPGVATGTVKLSVNLPASDPIGAPARTTSVAVADANGNQFAVTLSFTHIGLRTWTVQATGVQSADPTNPATVTSPTTTLTFDDQGALTSPAQLPIALAAPKGALAPTIDFGGNGDASIATTLRDSQFALNGTQADGLAPGYSTGFSLDERTGVISEVSSTGRIVPRYQLFLIDYNNPDGLEAVTGNAYLASETSGTPVARLVNTDGVGTVSSGRLEQANVDLSDEFQDLITAQRYFSANGKVVTTVDDMYQVATRLGG